jgi:hypothetical protein
MPLSGFFFDPVDLDKNWVIPLISKLI